MSHEPEWCEYGNCRDTSKHEPECVSCHYLYGHRELRGSECICDALRAAYRRGAADGLTQGRREGYESGYRDGYNDHARSRAYAEQVYGPYKAKTWGQVQGEAVVRQAEAITYFNQHGKGENP